MKQGVVYLGRRPLTYNQPWMTGGPYHWAKAGDCCWCSLEDAQRMTDNCSLDFVLSGEPFKGTRHVCPNCGRDDFKTKSGLSNHMKTCEAKK